MIISLELKLNRCFTRISSKQGIKGQSNSFLKINWFKKACCRLHWANDRKCAERKQQEYNDIDWEDLCHRNQLSSNRVGELELDINHQNIAFKGKRDEKVLKICFSCNCHSNFCCHFYRCYCCYLNILHLYMESNEKLDSQCSNKPPESYIHWETEGKHNLKAHTFWRSSYLRNRTLVSCLCSHHPRTWSLHWLYMAK